MTLILFFVLAVAVVDARLGEQHDSSKQNNPHFFAALQPATLMRGASPPAENMALMCVIDEHCADRYEQCVAGSCECQDGFVRLLDGSDQCTRIEDEVMASA